MRIVDYVNRSVRIYIEYTHSLYIYTHSYYAYSEYRIPCSSMCSQPNIVQGLSIKMLKEFLHGLY